MSIVQTFVQGFDFRFKITNLNSQIKSNFNAEAIETLVVFANAEVGANHRNNRRTK
jgi:hypothetical protein